MSMNPSIPLDIEICQYLRLDGRLNLFTTFALLDTPLSPVAHLAGFVATNKALYLLQRCALDQSSSPSPPPLLPDELLVARPKKDTRLVSLDQLAPPSSSFMKNNMNTTNNNMNNNHIPNSHNHHSNNNTENIHLHSSPPPSQRYWQAAKVPIKFQRHLKVEQTQPDLSTPTTATTTTTNSIHSTSSSSSSSSSSSTTTSSSTPIPSNSTHGPTPLSSPLPAPSSAAFHPRVLSTEIVSLSFNPSWGLAVVLRSCIPPSLPSSSVASNDPRLRGASRQRPSAPAPHQARQTQVVFHLLVLGSRSAFHPQNPSSLHQPPSARAFPAFSPDYSAHSPGFPGSNPQAWEAACPSQASLSALAEDVLSYPLSFLPCRVERFGPGFLIFGSDLCAHLFIPPPDNPSPPSSRFAGSPSASARFASSLSSMPQLSSLLPALELICRPVHPREGAVMSSARHRICDDAGFCCWMTAEGRQNGMIRLLIDAQRPSDPALPLIPPQEYSVILDGLISHVSFFTPFSLYSSSSSSSSLSTLAPCSSTSRRRSSRVDLLICGSIGYAIIFRDVVHLGLKNPVRLKGASTRFDGISCGLADALIPPWMHALFHPQPPLSTIVLGSVCGYLLFFRPSSGSPEDPYELCHSFNVGQSILGLSKVYHRGSLRLLVSTAFGIQILDLNSQYHLELMQKIINKSMNE